MSSIDSTITAIAPAFYPNEYHVRYLLKSAAKHKVKVRLYGLGQPYGSWMQVQVERLLDELRALTTPYVLYTDGSDVVYRAGIEDVWERYESLYKPPLLFAYERSGLNAGCWIGQREKAITDLEYIRDRYTDGDPQVRWRQAALEGKVRVLGDIGRRIFEVVEAAKPEFGDAPVLHFAGGWSDPVHGRAWKIEPIWEEMGYDK